MSNLREMVIDLRGTDRDSGIKFLEGLGGVLIDGGRLSNPRYVYMFESGRFLCGIEKPEKMSELFNIPLVTITELRQENLDELASQVKQLAKNVCKYGHSFIGALMAYNELVRIRRLMPWVRC